MEAFTRVLCPGIVRYDGRHTCPLFVKVEWSGGDDGKLSLTGVEGPKRNGDACGSCGQIIMFPWDFTVLADGWTPALVEQLRATWGRWHLNDMRAGLPEQETWLREHPDVPTDYTARCAALRDAGLLHVYDQASRVKPSTYTYGHGWRYEAVPADVLAWLASLPETTITPAWV